MNPSWFPCSCNSRHLQLSHHLWAPTSSHCCGPSGTSSRHSVGYPSSSWRTNPLVILQRSMPHALHRCFSCIAQRLRPRACLPLVRFLSGFWSGLTPAALAVIRLGFEGGSSVSQNSAIHHLLQEMFIARPQVKPLVLSWDLSEVLRVLAGSPFEPAWE